MILVKIHEILLLKTAITTKLLLDKCNIITNSDNI